MARLRLFIKGDYQSRKNSESPLYFEYTHNNTRARFSTDLKVDPIRFLILLDTDTNLYKISSTGACSKIERLVLQEKNEKIAKTQNELNGIIKAFSLKGFTISPDQLEREFYSKPVVEVVDPSPNQQKSIYQWLADFIISKEREIGDGIKSYKGTRGKLDKFLGERGITNFSELKLLLLEEFRNEMLSKGLKPTTIHKQFKNLRIFINWVKDHDEDIVIPSGYMKIKVVPKYGKPIGLSKEKFIQLFNFNLTDRKELDITRDAFILGVSIGGPRFQDLKKIWNKIRVDSSKSKKLQISYYEQKTGNYHNEIQLNLFGLSILEKYDQKLPRIPSLNRMNKNMKKIAGMLDWDDIETIPRFNTNGSIQTFEETTIKKLFSTKFMRKTAMTIDQDLGVSPKISMKRSGHLTFEAFNRYIDVDKLDMKSAEEPWNKIFVQSSI